MDEENFDAKDIERTLILICATCVMMVTVSGNTQSPGMPITETVLSSVDGIRHRIEWHLLADTNTRRHTHTGTSMG
jgi:hypothetical protein